MNKAIIIGASSGIGKELAKIFDTHNYSIGIVARRLNLLKELQANLQNKSYIKQIDISKIDDAQKMAEQFTDTLFLDFMLIVINLG